MDAPHREREFFHVWCIPKGKEGEYFIAFNPFVYNRRTKEGLLLRRPFKGLINCRFIGSLSLAYTHHHCLMLPTDSPLRTLIIKMERP